MTQPLNASAVALITMSHHADGRTATDPAPNPTILACQGPEAFWSDYMDLCRTRRDLISRILRLSPHTLALSDIQRHPRLSRRVTCLESLLLRHDLNDIFAVPTIGHHLAGTMAIMAGRDLDLRRSRRYLMGRISMDVLTRLATVRDVHPPAGSKHPSDQRGLTRRQLEIAHWLVAGKTDWEIGEILRISHKTVNDHVERMKSRYGVHSRNQFVAAFVQEGSPTSTAPHDEKPRQRQ